MKLNEIANFLEKTVEPLKDRFHGYRYRAAARLKDGTYLPCVVFESRQARVDLALRRFEELQSKPSQYRQVVESFISNGSCVWDYHLQDVEVSPFAWSLDLLNTIHGETIMSWTAFVAEMRDGTMHSYGTPFNFEFFDLPQGYSHSDIVKIHSGMLYSVAQGMEKFSVEASKRIKCYRDKPFFTCYLNEIRRPEHTGDPQTNQGKSTTA